MSGLSPGETGWNGLQADEARVQQVRLSRCVLKVYAGAGAAETWTGSTQTLNFSERKASSYGVRQTPAVHQLPFQYPWSKQAKTEGPAGPGVRFSLKGSADLKKLPWKESNREALQPSRLKASALDEG